MAQDTQDGQTHSILYRQVALFVGRTDIKTLPEPIESGAASFEEVPSSLSTEVIEVFTRRLGITNPAVAENCIECRESTGKQNKSGRRYRIAQTLRRKSSVEFERLLTFFWWPMYGTSQVRRKEGLDELWSYTEACYSSESGETVRETVEAGSPRIDAGDGGQVPSVLF
ncbi:hypothetical protein J6590_090459 [Homalodisca vitripennis]|nr:hypothetical protein J6590_090459 [Homalodisca vitripennis]